MTCLERLQDLNRLSAEGKTMEGFEKHYHENVTVTEMPTGEVRQGKNAQREAIQGWFGSVKEMHGGGVGAVTSNEEDQTTCCESWFDVTFADGNRMTMKEVGVQKWQDGQIIDEKFYYNMPGQ